MTAKKPSRLLRFFTAFFNVSWYIMLFLTILCALALVLCVPRLPENRFTNFVVPVGIDLLKLAENMEKYENEPEIVRVLGYSEVHLAIKARKVFFYYVIYALAIGILALAWIWQLRMLLRRVRDGRPFARENPGRIRKVAFLMIAAAPLNSLWDWWLGKSYLHYVSLPSPSFVRTMLPYWEAIILGLIILLIAQVFDEGVKMQEEQELTV